MKHTRVRTDNFETNGTLLRVTGRQGYEKSTDVWITREAEVHFEHNGGDTNDPGWNVLGGDLMNQNFYNIPHQLTQLNLTGEVQLQLAPHPICNSLDSLKIKPVGCKSFYDAYPKTQSKLLPYLVPEGTRSRVGFQETDTHTATFDESSEVGALPDDIFWNPLVNGNFVFTTHANATVVGDANSLVNTGYCPREVGGNSMIQFGTVQGAVGARNGNTFAPFHGDQHLIRVEYDAVKDELTYNLQENVVIKIDRHVLNQAIAPATGFHYFGLSSAFQTPYTKNDFWAMKFDKDGIAGRVAQHGLDTVVTSMGGNQKAEQWFGVKNGLEYADGADNGKYMYSATEYNEFWEIFLWDAGNTEKFAAINLNNAAIPGGHAGNTLRLFLRRPKFSKGQARNWGTDPGINRIFPWFDKVIDPNGPVEHRAEGPNLLPTAFNTFGQPNAPKYDVMVGAWSVTWVDSGVANNQGQRPQRMINRLTIQLEDGVLYDRINALPDGTTVCLKLRSGLHVAKTQAAFQGDRPPVIIAENLEAQTFFLLFLKEQATYLSVGVVYTIEFRRLGGAIPLWHDLNAAFANGKPMIGSVGDLFGANAPLQAGAWLTPSTVGQTLWGVPSVLGANPFGSNVTTVPLDFAQNTRPLFNTDILEGEQFSRHDKLLVNEFGAGAPGEALFDALDAMFQGIVYIEEPELINYRNVLCGRSKATQKVTFNEPLFGLDSGMSTYGVNKIFKPKPWHSILLQDMDYFFPHPSRLDAVYKRGNTGQYNIVATREDEKVKESFPGTAVFTHSDSTKLTVRSRDGLDQRVKLLEHVHDSYPLFEKYKIQVAAAAAPSGTVSIYSERGVPDFLFIYAERNLREGSTFIPSGNPIITGISFYGRANSRKTLGFPYLTSKHELWQATLRNAHYQSKAEDLYEIGGCLVSREDLGTMERQDFRLSEPFDYDMKVTLENETGGSDTEQTQRNTDDITLHVCCIYEDSVILKGTAQNLAFIEEKRN